MLVNRPRRPETLIASRCAREKTHRGDSVGRGKGRAGEGTTDVPALPTAFPPSLFRQRAAYLSGLLPIAGGGCGVAEALVHPRAFFVVSRTVFRPRVDLNRARVTPKRFGVLLKKQEGDAADTPDTPFVFRREGLGKQPIGDGADLEERVAIFLVVRHDEPGYQNAIVQPKMPPRLAVLVLPHRAGVREHAGDVVPDPRLVLRDGGGSYEE